MDTRMVAKAAPLLLTKLFVPPSRQSLVTRPRLLTRLDESIRYALTLVCAPAGYGKTTLLAEWIQNCRLAGKGYLQSASNNKQFAWVSLDLEDNDPLRFVSYLSASLESMQPETGKEVQALLGAFPSPPLPTLLTFLINGLNQLSSHFILVLDDYQFITNTTIHEGIAFLLDHLPPNLHLLIASRSDPPIPIARFRASNQLLELRAEDLRFTAGEASEFLVQGMGLPLSSDNIMALDQRTEGWIAGLQMAALALRGALSTRSRADANRYIESFSGSHRYIMDYLAEEVLNRQPGEIVQFLMSTSILDRLSAPLCDAVLGEGQTTAQEALEYLDRANLFLVSLDDERCWFRYHHLFAGLLRARLQQAGPDLVPNLHMRASTWYEQNGWIEEAVLHANQAKNWENTARLLEQNLQDYLERGQLSTILKWVEALPQEWIRQRPKLCIRVAEALAHAGQMDKIGPFLEGAETVANPRESHTGEGNLGLLTPAEIAEIRALAAMLRGLLAVVSGNPAHGLALAQTALSEIPEIDLRERAWLHWVAGFAYRSLGKLQQAFDFFTEATRLGKESGMTLRDFWTDLAITTRLLGKLSQAGDIFAESLQIAAERGSRNQGNLSRDEAYLSGILLEQNQLEQALAHARKAVEYTQWWPSHNHIATANTFLALILLAHGDLEGSDQAIQKADQERKKGLVTPFVHSLVDRTLARVWLAQGDWVVLDEWVNAMLAIKPSGKEACSGIDEYREMRLTTLARVWLEKARLDKSAEPVEAAVSLLACLEKNARAAERVNALIEILTIKASALQMMRNKTEALKEIEECFRLAEPGGYARVFVDAGEPLRDLLITYLHTPETSQKAYAQKLLEAFPGSPEAALPGASQNDLAEPLTSREVDVLRLMAAGFSNRQIAEELVLAEGTVKFYVHTVLEKLGVHSRTQAIASAREHGLI